MIHLINLPNEKQKFAYAGVLIISAVCDGFLLIVIILSTFKCIGNYGQGFKEMILKQRIFDASADLDMTTNVNVNVTDSKVNEI